MSCKLITVTVERMLTVFSSRPVVERESEEGLPRHRGKVVPICDENQTSVLPGIKGLTLTTRVNWTKKGDGAVWVHR